jgi:5-methylcytosine-specific restriction protein A
VLSATKVRNSVFNVIGILSADLNLHPMAKYLKRRVEADRHIADQKVRNRIFKRDKRKCRACGWRNSLSIDHIVAVARGGGDEDENLQTLCLKCNSKKGTNHWILPTDSTPA